MAMSTPGLTQQLIEAIVSNNLNKARRCLARGANPNSYEDKAKIRPLHFAVLYHALECAKLLMTVGADPLARDHDGQTPFDLAQELNYPEVLHLFKIVSQNNNRPSFD